jgi:type IV pilus assembly protein PilV
MKTIPYLKKKLQQGSMLLEALFGILIFSLGILALVGLQTSSVKQSNAGRYRTDAAMLANQLVGTMWVSDHAFLGNYATGGLSYMEWAAQVTALLPGAAANPPLVVVAVDGTVTINIFWRGPSEPATEPVHNFQMTTRIPPSPPGV